MAPPNSPVWFDNDVLVKIDNGREPGYALKISNLQKDGHEALITTSVELEFLHGRGFRPADTVRRRALQKSLGINVDTAANRVPMQQLRAWRDEGIKHGLAIDDANNVAQIRASAQARGIENPIFFTDDAGGTLIRMRQRGVMALEFKTLPSKPQIPAHLKAPTPKEVPPRPIGSVAAEAAEAAEAYFTGGKGLFKAGLKAGLKDLLSAENIAATIPDVILDVADRVAAQATLNKIKDKFKREGVAKGVAAGVMGWTEMEVASNLMNHVTAFRLEGLQDPAGFLPYSTMLKVAERQENYAVSAGFLFSSSKTSEWKREIRGKGFKVLREFRYYFGEDPQALFEYDFIEKLAWVLRPTTDAMIDHGHHQ